MDMMLGKIFNMSDSTFDGGRRVETREAGFWNGRRRILSDAVECGESVGWTLRATANERETRFAG